MEETLELNFQTIKTPPHVKNDEEDTLFLLFQRRSGAIHPVQRCIDIMSPRIEFQLEVLLLLLVSTATFEAMKIIKLTVSIEFI